MFTTRELDYLRSQRLARIATAAPDGQPDAAPVTFEFDGTYFWVGGRDLLNTRKYKNVHAGNVKVALVIDDLVSVDPWQTRGIRVYGTAELVEVEGPSGPVAQIRIAPQVSWSWGIEAGSHAYTARGPRKTIHAVPG